MGHMAGTRSAAVQYGHGEYSTYSDCDRMRVAEAGCWATKQPDHNDNTPQRGVNTKQPQMVTTTSKAKHESILNAVHPRTDAQQSVRPNPVQSMILKRRRKSHLSNLGNQEK